MGGLGSGGKKESVAAGWPEGLSFMHLAGRGKASLLLHPYWNALMRGQMTKSPLHLPQVLVLVIAAGCALPVAAQDAGPMPPPPASASAPASQPATQKPQDGSAGAPAAGQSTPAAGADAAPGAAAPAANGTTSSAGAAAAPAVVAAAKIMVPAGTHIPLVLHNAVST